jgi:hypothetical protein
LPPPNGSAAASSKWASAPAFRCPTIRGLTLNRAQAALPLGWVLSDLVRREIREQTRRCLPGIAEAACSAKQMQALLREMGY